jgi:uncharacterized integral membrane protein
MADDRNGTESTIRSSAVATLVLAALVAAGLGAFIVQNGEDSTVNWLFMEGQWPLWAVIVVSAVAGALLSEVLGWLVRRRRH